MVEQSLERVRSILTEHEARYRFSAMRWINAYRLLLVTSALFSTAAAVVGKLEYFKLSAGSDIASILAAAAAVVTTLIATLDFEVNARINRRSRHNVAALLLEVEKSNANPDSLLSALQAVVQSRSEDLCKPD